MNLLRKLLKQLRALLPKLRIVWDYSEVEWTTEEPEARRIYWLSIHPDKRPAFHGADFPAVIKCHVDLMSPGFQWVVDGIEPTKHVRYEKGGDWLPLDQDWFSGAKWKRVDNDPKDPFAETERTAS